MKYQLFVKFYRLRHKDLSPSPQGIVVTFNRSKQRGQNKPSSFLVPKLTDVPSQPDPCKILELYLQVLKKWVPHVKPEDELFYQGFGPERKSVDKEK